MKNTQQETVKPSFDFLYLPVPNGSDAEPTGDLDEDGQPVTFVDLTDKLRYLTHVFEGPRDGHVPVREVSNDLRRLALEVVLTDGPTRHCFALIGFHPEGGDWEDWERLAEARARGAEAEINLDLGSHRYILKSFQIVRTHFTLERFRLPEPPYDYEYPSRRKPRG